ncbi:MAG: TrbC/VirB2 family protein [bacterium]|nr:TrbC/VirB2 family protein [bacterium]
MNRLRSLLWSLIIVFSLVSPALAAESADVTRVENFIKNIIQVLVTLAGLIAAGFFVMGGIGYITSSGNPEHLDRSKKTIVFSAFGLAIAIAALVLSNIIADIATKAFGS